MESLSSYEKLRRIATLTKPGGPRAFFKTYERIMTN